MSNKYLSEVIKLLKESQLCKEENGAYYLDLEKENIAGRNQKFFFTRENGLSIYTTRDIAYHIEKKVSNQLSFFQPPLGRLYN